MFAVDVLARVSEVMTLLPGDVVAGDRVEVRIDGVGCLENLVVRR